jgi:hypothetical protein
MINYKKLGMLTLLMGVACGSSTFAMEGEEGRATPPLRSGGSSGERVTPPLRSGGGSGDRATPSLSGEDGQRSPSPGLRVDELRHHSMTHLSQAQKERREREDREAAKWKKEADKRKNHPQADSVCCLLL